MVKGSTGAALIALAILGSVAHAQQDKPKASPKLTAMDYIEIQQLVNRYAFAIDSCANNGYDYADLYTPDGVFYWGVGARKSVGREQLAEAAGGGKNGCKKLQDGKLHPNHVTQNLVIEPAPGGATGKSYLVYPGEEGVAGDPTHAGHVGGYQDFYVKTAQGWRIKKRIHIFPPGIAGSYKFPEE